MPLGVYHKGLLWKLQVVLLQAVGLQVASLGVSFLNALLSAYKAHVAFDLGMGFLVGSQVD